MARYSLGVQSFCCRKIRLKVDMLEKPERSAISVMDRSGWASRLSATFNRLKLRYSEKVESVNCLNRLVK